MKKFFSYKLHFIFLVLLASAASSVAVVMKLNLGLEQSKQSQVRSEAIHKMNPFKHLVSLKIEEIRNDLLNFALARKTHEATPQFGLFNSIALVQLSGTEFAPKWIESVRNNEVWTNEYRSAALKTLAFQKIEESGFVWSKYQEGNNKPVYFSIIEIEAHNKKQNRKAYIVGMSPSNPLSGVADDFRGSTGKMFLLNDKAFVAAHTSKNYDGSSFAAEPIYQEIKASKRAMSSGNFVDSNKDPIFGYYEKIEHSNLYAVVNSPKLNAPLAASLWQTSWPTIAGMLAFFAFLAFVFAQKLLPKASAAKPQEPVPALTISHEDSAESEFENFEQKRVDSKNLRTELMKRGLASLNPFVRPRVDQAITPDVIQSSPTSRADSNEKTIELLKMMSRGLNRIFSDRISSMIAESSLILSKSADTEINAHAKILQDEARKSRELLRELDQVNSVQHLNLASVSVAEVCEHALAKWSDQIEAEGILVSMDFDRGFEIKASIEKFQMAIEKIISNSIEALKGRAEKKLSFKIQVVNGQGELVISDNGIGMPKEVQDKIFLPFYREFSNLDGNGLGLAYTHGVISGMRGDLRVQSSPGVGTDMIIQFARPAHEAPLTFDNPIHESLKNPKLKLDFVEDALVAPDYFELEEEDLDQEFDEHLKKLSDKMIQKNIKNENTNLDEILPEFNQMQGFESEDEDVDDFKVVIREPRTKTIL